MIIVLGAKGFLGQAFTRHLEASGHQYRGISRNDIDYYNPDILAKLLRETQAQFLVNAAGYTGQPNVDACEDNKSECLYANSVLPGRIALACERTQVPWGHVSSGCIYNGIKQDRAGFQESDTPNFSFRTNNCSFYSGTKALAEEILAHCSECYVWRIRIPFNNVNHPRNYLTKLLTYERLLQATNSLSQLDDVISACLECWRLRVPYGTYNLTNSGSIQTSEVVAMLRQTIAPNREFEFFEDEAEFMRVAALAPRSNCVLDNSKALAAGLRLSDVHDAIELSLSQWKC